MLSGRAAAERAAAAAERARRRAGDEEENGSAEADTAAANTAFEKRLVLRNELAAVVDSWLDGAVCDCAAKQCEPLADWFFAPNIGWRRRTNRCSLC